MRSGLLVPLFVVGLGLLLLPMGAHRPTVAEESTAVAPPAVTVHNEEITPACRRSIERGMAWLLTTITRRGVGTDVDRAPDLSCAAIVGLALLSEGNTLSSGRHSRELSTVLDAVLLRLEDAPQGRAAPLTLTQRKIGKHADLFLSALFLSQLLGEAGRSDEEIRRALQKLVRRIAQAQGPDGTWGDESWAPVLGTVLGWESLRASSSCGLTIDASAEQAGKALLEKLKTQSPTEFDWMHNFYKEASSVRVLYSLDYRDDPAFEACVQRIVKVAREDDRPFLYAGGEEYLAFFLVTECLLQNPRPAWQPWYPHVRDKIMRQQNRDGSWSGHHCITSRTFCTAAALLTLQAPDRSLCVSDL